MRSDQGASPRATIFNLPNQLTMARLILAVIMFCLIPWGTSATYWTLDSPGIVGAYPSLAIGADGLGLIAYLDDTDFDLKTVHCSNRYCMPWHQSR